MLLHFKMVRINLDQNLLERKNLLCNTNKHTKKYKKQQQKQQTSKKRPTPMFTPQKIMLVHHNPKTPPQTNHIK